MKDKKELKDYASIFNEKSLYFLNIKDLRDLGKALNMSSPTTLSKKELIDSILKIIYGKELPTGTNYGRPNSRKFNLDKCVEKITNKTDTMNVIFGCETDFDYGFGTMKIASPKEEIVIKNIKTRVFYSEGDVYELRVHQFVPTAEDIKISKQLAEKLNLKPNDVLEVIIEDDNFKIISVNGIGVEDKFEDFLIESEMIKAGKNEDFYVCTKEEKNKIIENISRECLDRNIVLVIFSQKKYTDWCTEHIGYDTGEGYSQMYKNFMKMIGICEKLMFETEDVLLVIDDAKDINDMFDYFDEEIGFRTRNNVDKFKEKFLALQNGMVTIRTIENQIY